MKVGEAEGGLVMKGLVCDEDFEMDPLWDGDTVEGLLVEGRCGPWSGSE